MSRSINTIAFSMVMLVIVAPNVSSQVVASAASLHSAQIIAGSAKLVSAPRLVGDTMIVEFQDSTFTFDKFTSGMWTFGPRNLFAPSSKQVGKDIAQAIWSGTARDSGIKTIIVDVHGVAKGDNVRFFYRTAELSPH